MSEYQWIAKNGGIGGEPEAVERVWSSKANLDSYCGGDLAHRGDGLPPSVKNPSSPTTLGIAVCREHLSPSNEYEYEVRNPDTM
jgi:hypothetical protein